MYIFITGPYLPLQTHFISLSPFPMNHAPTLLIYPPFLEKSMSFCLAAIARATSSAANTFPLHLGSSSEHHAHSSPMLLYSAALLFYFHYIGIVSMWGSVFQ